MKIDKNIPIPVSHHSNSKYAHLINDMEIGDSVEVKTFKTKSSIYQSMWRKGFKPVSRKVEGENSITYRIWRTA